MDKELNKAIKNLKKFAYTTTGTFSMKEAKIILNYIQNSIPKKKIEDKIEELKHMQIGAGTGIYAAQVDILEELLNKN